MIVGSFAGGGVGGGGGGRGRAWWGREWWGHRRLVRFDRATVLLTGVHPIIFVVLLIVGPMLGLWRWRWRFRYCVQRKGWQPKTAPRVASLHLGSS